MRGLAKKNKGFILIEILVSLLLLSVGILFLIRSLSTITKSNSQVRDNRLAYLLIDNIYNSLYSQEQITPGIVLLDGKEYLWDFTVNNTGDGLKHLAINVTWGKNNLSSAATLAHTVIDVNDKR